MLRQKEANVGKFSLNRNYSYLFLLLSGTCFATTAQAGHGSSGPGTCQTDPASCYTNIDLSTVGTSGAIGTEIVAGYGALVSANDGYKLNNIPSEALATFSLTGLPYNTPISFSFAPGVSFSENSSTASTGSVSGNGATLSEKIDPVAGSAIFTALNTSGSPISLLLSFQTSSYYTANITNSYSVVAAPAVTAVPVPASLPMFSAAILGLVGIGAKARRKITA